MKNPTQKLSFQEIREGAEMRRAERLAKMNESVSSSDDDHEMVMFESVEDLMSATRKAK